MENSSQFPPLPQIPPHLVIEENRTEGSGGPDSVPVVGLRPPPPDGAPLPNTVLQLQRVDHQAGSQSAQHTGKDHFVEWLLKPTNPYSTALANNQITNVKAKFGETGEPLNFKLYQVTKDNNGIEKYETDPNNFKSDLPYKLYIPVTWKGEYPDPAGGTKEFEYTHNFWLRAELPSDRSDSVKLEETMREASMEAKIWRQHFQGAFEQGKADALKLKMYNTASVYFPKIDKNMLQAKSNVLKKNTFTVKSRTLEGERVTNIDFNKLYKESTPTRLEDIPKIEGVTVAEISAGYAQMKKMFQATQAPTLQDRFGNFTQSDFASYGTYLTQSVHEGTEQMKDIKLFLADKVEKPNIFQRALASVFGWKKYDDANRYKEKVERRGESFSFESEKTGEKPSLLEKIYKGSYGWNNINQRTEQIKMERIVKLKKAAAACGKAPDDDVAKMKYNHALKLARNVEKVYDENVEYVNTVLTRLNEIDTNLGRQQENLKFLNFHTLANHLQQLKNNGFNIDELEDRFPPDQWTHITGVWDNLDQIFPNGVLNNQVLIHNFSLSVQSGPDQLGVNGFLSLLKDAGHLTPQQLQVFEASKLVDQGINDNTILKNSAEHKIDQLMQKKVQVTQEVNLASRILREELVLQEVDEPFLTEDSGSEENNLDIFGFSDRGNVLNPPTNNILPEDFSDSEESLPEESPPEESPDLPPLPDIPPPKRDNL